MKKIGTKEGKNQHFWANPQGGTGTKTGWYRYPLTEPIRYRYQDKWYRYQLTECVWYQYQT